MNDPEKFYEGLWQQKRTDYAPPVRRDWFHRFILDPIFDPRSNPRNEVALSLLRGGGRVLDVGCWDGRLLEHIREAGLYQDYYGVDLVPEGVETARAKGFQAQVVDLNRQGLPFPDEHFDGVTILAVLEHVFDPYAVIREIYRVLRPGGELIIDVPNVASLTNRMRILSGRLPITSSDSGWDGGHLHYFTKHALDQFLANEGFKIIIRRATGGHPRIREKWISLMAGELTYACQRSPKKVP